MTLAFLQLTEHPLIQGLFLLSAAFYVLWGLAIALFLMAGALVAFDRAPKARGVLGWVGAGLLLLMLLFTLGGCSWLGQAAEHTSQLLDTRQEKQQSGWEWEGFLTCDERPQLHLEADGERWCTRELAPTLSDCMSGHGMQFWFGDSLSGISRQVLYDLCRKSEVGERWRHLDGVYSDGKLVVRDANRGSKPL